MITSTLEKKGQHEIKELGDWLYFFLFSLFVSIILNFIIGISDISKILKTAGLVHFWLYSLVFLDFLYFGGLIAFTIYTILAFLKLKKNAVSLGKMYLILIFLNNFLIILISALTGKPIASTTSCLGSRQIIINRVVLSVLWFLYLTLSTRVNHIFPKEKRKTKTLDKLFLSVLLAITILVFALISIEIKPNHAYNVSSTEEWKVFTSPICHFQATFPSTPTHNIKNIQIPNTSISLKYHSYVCQVRDLTAYSVNTATYPSEIDTSNPKTFIGNAFNAVVASKNKVISSNFTYFDNYRALNYKILIKKGNIYLQGKIILVGQTIYLLIVAYKNGNYNEKDYNKFINSFNLK